MFCRTKRSAKDLAEKLIAKKYATDAIHGDLQQKERDKVMRAFKNKHLQLLVATDIAARGIDVASLSYILHYELPESVAVETPSQTQIVLKSYDKQALGQVASEIRAFRPPEPYKGKGVKYSDEIIKRKEAKKAAGGA